MNATDNRDTTALVVQDPAGPPTLFGTQDPQAIIESASARATALADVIKRQKLAVNISGREHVRIEGWTLLGSLVGVFPVTTWSRETESGWEARVEARTLSGAIVGAAEAECSRDEPTWKGRPSFALRSMAQTRATSKAMRMPLGFIMSLAGYDPTPAEEMEHLQQAPRAATTPVAPPAPASTPEEPPTDAEWREIVNDDEELPPQKLCNCGQPRIRRTGEKNGKPWAGWFCQVKGNDGKYVCAPVFEN